MDDSERLEEVPFSGFTHKQAGQGGNDIEDEVTSQVVLSNLVELFQTVGLLHEIHKDFNEVDDVDDHLNSLQ